VRIEHLYIGDDDDDVVIITRLLSFFSGAPSLQIRVVARLLRWR